MFQINKYVDNKTKITWKFKSQFQCCLGGAGEGKRTERQRNLTFDQTKKVADQVNDLNFNSTDLNTMI